MMKVFRRSRQAVAVAGIIVLALLASGCVLSPKGTKEQNKELEAAGKPYEKPFEQRQLPEIPQPATWQDVLQRSLLSSGDLEAAYHEWRAASERITMASYWPNSNLQLGFEYMFTKEAMKTWDRVTISASTDPSMPLKLPNKVAKGGEVAYANALQAAQTFRSTKFAIQKQVLTAYFDLALMEEQIRIETDNLDLLKLSLQNARSRLQTGGAQQDLIKTQLAVRVAENSIATMKSQAATMRGMLNGMMNRKGDAAIVLPDRLPDPRVVNATDDQLIAMGVDASPEIARLAAQVKGRKDAIDLAKMQYLPDISPAAAITGDVSRSIGAMVMVPTTIPMINASIREAKAMRDASEAMLRQTKSDRTGRFVGTLYAMRNSERQEKFFDGTVLPLANQLVASSRQDYTSGKVGLIELLDAQRALLDVRRSIAESRVDREKRLAELEELAGVDVEVTGKEMTNDETRMTNQ